MGAPRRQGILFCFVGAAASGKTTFCQRLLSDFSGQLAKSISTTSRPPRSGEVPGSSYYFISRGEFEAKVAAGEFFEWEETHGNLYGTLAAPLNEAIASGKDVLLDVDIRGSQTFKARFAKNAVVTFIAPPSSAVLKERLIKRGSVAPAELELRLQTARREYDSVLSLLHRPGAIDYFVVNDDLEAAYRMIGMIVTSEQARFSRLDPDDLKKICSLS